MVTAALSTIKLVDYHNENYLKKPIYITKKKIHRFCFSIDYLMSIDTRKNKKLR